MRLKLTQQWRPAVFSCGNSSHRKPQFWELQGTPPYQSIHLGCVQQSTAYHFYLLNLNRISFHQKKMTFFSNLLMVQNVCFFPRSDPTKDLWQGFLRHTSQIPEKKSSQCVSYTMKKTFAGFNFCDKAKWIINLASKIPEFCALA